MDVNDEQNSLPGDPCRYITTSMADFQPPQILSQIKGQRKEMLQRFYWKEVSKEFFDAMIKMPCENDCYSHVSTTYNDHFDMPGFKVDENAPPSIIDPEVLARHPLYDDPAITVYSQNIHRIKPTSKGKHPAVVFRKSSIFTKKWYDELE